MPCRRSGERLPEAHALGHPEHARELAADDGQPHPAQIAADHGVRDVLDQETFGQTINWKNSIIGINKDGLIEVRDKKTLDLQIIASPTCYDGSAI